MNDSSISVPERVFEIAALLGDPDVSTDALIRLLGPVRQSYPGAAYDLLPRDSRFVTVRVGLGGDAEKPEAPFYVEIGLAPTLQLAVADLDLVLGTRHKLAPTPRGPLNEVAYDRSLGGDLFKATVFAKLSDPAELPGAVVQTLMIRRDRRSDEDRLKIQDLRLHERR